LKKLNIWMLGILLFIGVLFIMSPIGRDLQVFLFGNPCEQGYIYDSPTKQCILASTQLACGSGTYLKHSLDKGYTCELSNFTIAILLLVFGLAIYFYIMNKAGEAWRPAKDCFRLAINGGHLATKRQNWVDAWDACKEPHQVIPHNAWLLIGDFVQPGAEYSALITGTDNRGWVLDLWRYPLQERQIQILKKQGMKLDQALLEVAKAKQQVEAATLAFNEEQEGMQ
jgi:hypothetical protein